MDGYCRCEWAGCGCDDFVFAGKSKKVSLLNQGEFPWKFRETLLLNLQRQGRIIIELQPGGQNKSFHIQQSVSLLIAGEMEIRGRILEIILDLLICHFRILAQKKGSGTGDDGSRHGGAATGGIARGIAVIGRAAGNDIGTGSNDVRFGDHPPCRAPAGIIVNSAARRA